MVSAASPPPTGMPQNMTAAVDAAFSGRLISAAMAIMLGKRRAKAQACAKSHGQQRVVVAGERGGESEAAEHGDRAEQYRLATRSVRQPAAETGADDQSEIADAEDPAHLRRIERELRRQARRRHAHCLNVEALEHRDQETQAHGHRHVMTSVHVFPSVSMMATCAGGAAEYSSATRSA